MKQKVKKLILILTLASIVFTPMALVPREANGASKDDGIFFGLLKEDGNNGYRWKTSREVVTDTKDAIVETVSDTVESVKQTLNLGSLLNVAAEILNSVIKVNPFQNIGKFGEFINNGNRFILNLANLGFILLLLVIAGATILNIQQYAAGRLLPRLIIVILLANFALFAVVAITDFSQILMQGLVGQGNANIVSPILESVQKRISETSTGESIVKALYTVGSFGLNILLDPLFWLMLAIGIIAIVLLLRIIGLWVLAIFAPVGIVLFALPNTQSLAAKYWRKVVSYAFIGPLMLFFIKLAVIFYETIEANPLFSANSSADTIETYRRMGFISFTGIVQTIGTIIILAIGLVMARKMGVEVANWTFGQAEKAFRLGIKGVKAVGKGVVMAGSAALAIPTGGTSLGAAIGAGAARIGGSALGTLGVSGATRASVGNFVKGFGNNLVKGNKTGTVSNAIGRVIEGAGAQYEKGPYTRNDLNVPLSAKRGDRYDSLNKAYAAGLKDETTKGQMDAINEEIKDGRDNPLNIAPIQPAIDYVNEAGITPEENGRRALWAARQGYINSDNYPDYNLHPDYAGRVLGEAAKTDPFLRPEVQSALTPQDKLAALRKAIAQNIDPSNFDNFSPEALRKNDGALGNILIDEKPSDMDRVISVFKPEQLNALINAVKGGFDADAALPNPTISAQQFEGRALTALKAGANLGELFANSNRPVIEKRVVDKAVKDAATFKNQTPEGAIQIINKIDDSALQDAFSKLSVTLRSSLKAASKQGPGPARLGLSETKAAIIRNTPFVQATK